jgi:hypothetical protein|tara:strand:+ start:845 stop:979 length:135 start_codon:yes stop_codon:yes gene_type:complete
MLVKQNKTLFFGRFRCISSLVFAEIEIANISPFYLLALPKAVPI